MFAGLYCRYELCSSLPVGHLLVIIQIPEKTAVYGLLHF